MNIEMFQPIAYKILLLGVLPLLVVASQVLKYEKTYIKYDADVTQTQAHQACKQLGGRLAFPSNKWDDKIISKLIGVSFETNPWPAYWITGNDRKREGVWIDSVTGERLDYTNFQPHQPDNFGDNEHCIEVSPTYPQWNDRDCDNIAAGYICEFTK